MSDSTTLSQIVEANPATARILEQYHLDYCCGGNMTLNQACADQGIDPEKVRVELEVSPQEDPDWNAMSVRELVDHIENVHHGYLHREMPRLQTLMDKVLGVHGERHPELAPLAEKLQELIMGFAPHLKKEELMLFPAIRTACEATEVPGFPFGSIANPINVMLSDHDRDGAIIAEMREITNGWKIPVDACASYRALYRGLEELEADTHLHIHKENNVLFPGAIKIEERLNTKVTQDIVG